MRGSQLSPASGFKAGIVPAGVSISVSVSVEPPIVVFAVRGGSSTATTGAATRTGELGFGTGFRGSGGAFARATAGGLIR